MTPQRSTFERSRGQLAAARAPANEADRVSLGDFPATQPERGLMSYAPVIYAPMIRPRIVAVKNLNK